METALILVFLFINSLGIYRLMSDAADFKADVALLQEKVNLVASGFVVVKAAIDQLRADIAGGATLKQADLDALDSQVELMTSTLAGVVKAQEEAVAGESPSSEPSGEPSSGSTESSDSAPSGDVAPTE